MKNSIGQNIKRLRKAFNYTQEELAERINVTAQAISKWENEMGMPDISQLIPLATVFGVSTDTILGMESIDGKNEALRILEQAEARQEIWTERDLSCCVRYHSKWVKIISKQYDSSQQLYGIGFIACLTGKRLALCC